MSQQLTEEQIANKYYSVLRSDRIDIDELIALNVYPIPPYLRACVWQYYCGYLPTNIEEYLSIPFTNL